MSVITTEFPEVMSEQQIFDHVAVFLIKQNKQSQRLRMDGASHQCMYRGENGTACAVGCLIRDDEYVPEMDSGRLTSVVQISLLATFPQRLKPHLVLLRKLQDIHDSTPPFDWKSNLMSLAQNYEFDTKVLE